MTAFPLPAQCLKYSLVSVEEATGPTVTMPVGLGLGQARARANALQFISLNRHIHHFIIFLPSHTFSNTSLLPPTTPMSPGISQVLS